MRSVTIIIAYNNIYYDCCYTIINAAHCDSLIIVTLLWSWVPTKMKQVVLFDQVAGNSICVPAPTIGRDVIANTATSPCNGTCSRLQSHLCWPVWRCEIHTRSCDGTRLGSHGRWTGMRLGAWSRDVAKWNPKTCPHPMKKWMWNGVIWLSRDMLTLACVCGFLFWVWIKLGNCKNG